VPVVVSSAETQQHGLIKAFKLGAANFLRKPYEKEELGAIVEKTLGYKLRFVEDLKVMPSRASASISNCRAIFR
jgi:DNA-binding NtrC family response regulator